MKNFKKTFLLFVIVFFIGMVAGVFITKYQAELEQPTIISKPEEITVSLMLDFGDGTIKTYTDIKLNKNKTVLDLLKRCSKDVQNHFELDYDIHPEWGAFIKKIGEKENRKDDKYWQYWVNNIYATIGASQFELKNGDVVEWKFIKSLF